MTEPEPIQIQPEQLSPPALRRVIEEFVTRDGTEFTDMDVKVEQVKKLLRQSKVELWFEPETGTCNIVSATSES